MQEQRIINPEEMVRASVVAKLGIAAAFTFFGAKTTIPQLITADNTSAACLAFYNVLARRDLAAAVNDMCASAIIGIMGVIIHQTFKFSPLASFIFAATLVRILAKTAVAHEQQYLQPQR